MRGESTQHAAGDLVEGLPLAAGLSGPGQWLVDQEDSAGILGEYIGRIYDEVKQRPLYVIHKTYGFDNPEVQVEK